jgi:2-polyprenyl-6-methoxyphenol hydroxylase-like FAD-dependent oxidoreductase
VRTQLLARQEPLYAGYVAWRGLVDEQDIPAFAHDQLFERFAFCLPNHEQMIGYPVAGENHDLRRGHRRYNFVWYRPADEELGLADLLTDPSGARHRLNIPPPLIRPEIITAMRADADRLLAPAFAALVAATRTPFLQPIYDLAVPQMAFGRVALLGDAAFVARPHIGAGVTKACEDGLALAHHVRSDVPEGLQAWQAERLPAGARFVQRARHLGAYMQAVLKSEEEREAAERHHTPEAVMAETALLNF